VARHMFPIEDIKKHVDAIALMKMNRFHIHLTDDQGWRVPIAKYPKVAEMKRQETKFGSLRNPTYKGDNEPYGGYYTVEELKDLVDYCAKRHITVIPEFDIPGHTNCAIAAYSHLSCRNEQIQPRNREGVSKVILCVGKDEVMEFVYDCLEVFCDIFPGEYFHIGGDEAPKSRWKSCPHCQKRMKDNSLENEQQLQGWFNKQVAAFLAQRGKKTIVWNEGLYSGQMGNEVIGQRWFDPGFYAIRFANSGGKIIMSDNSSCYVDYLYSRLPLKKVYRYNPLKFGLNKRGKAGVMGLEAPLWTEYVKDIERASFQAFPRICATAELGWTAPSLGRKTPRPYSDFVARLRDFIPQLQALGVNSAPESIWNGSGRVNKLRTFPAVPRGADFLEDN